MFIARDAEGSHGGGGRDGGMVEGGPGGNKKKNWAGNTCDTAIRWVVEIVNFSIKRNLDNCAIPSPRQRSQSVCVGKIEIISNVLICRKSRITPITPLRYAVSCFKRIVEKKEAEGGLFFSSPPPLFFMIHLKRKTA